MYLETKIAEVKTTKRPSYGMTRDGYTKLSGAPSSYLLRLEGEKIWRRLMILQFSNAGSYFLKIKGETKIVKDSMLPN